MASGNPWMIFVDGENLTIRAQDLDEKLGGGHLGTMHERDVYYWSGGLRQQIRTNIAAIRAQVSGEPLRSYYYTCATGDIDYLNQLHEALQEHHFAPVVIQKIKGQRAKGVDISLTKDMLVHAFANHYNVAVLIAGDGDFVPLVCEVKRLGKIVIVAFFDEKNGLNPELRRVADSYIELNL